jgi:serine/threonine protein kinase
MASPGPGADGRLPANTPHAPFDPSTCPGHETLVAFDRGELSADTSELIGAHVEACDACQAVLGGLAGPPDSLLDGLRRVQRAAAAPVAPTVLTGLPVSAAAAPPPGYQLLEKIGSGGMGVVYRARDVRLNREVAVKLLRDNYPSDSAVCARFLAEAQITGQLQHPGIPAVHELGTLPDGRPFLAMKLVKGRTLHELLKERTELAQERGRFVAIFEQICQAVGYAHAHRVIHRDLKPGNVMVGAFGEVQVMDWGLAKVLASREPQRPKDDAELPETITAFTAIDTPLAGDSATRTGAVMGTPAYIAPEQAGGEIRKLDARSDVFGLGAILCQVLTGQPPFSGASANEIRLKAVRGELQEAFARLDGAGAEPDLVALCKRCLAFRQEDRPADGRAVAQEVTSIRQAAEERARQAELERAAALVREAEQRKRRRQLLTAAVVVAAVLVAGIVGTTIGLLQARQATEAERLAKRDAEAQKTSAEQANEQAQKRLKQIEKGSEILTSIFTDLDIRKINAGAEPLEAVLAKRLVNAAEELEGEAVGDPLMVAGLQDRLAVCILGLGYAKEAVPLFKRARVTRTTELGVDDLKAIESMIGLAEAYGHAGELEKSVPMLEEALQRMKADYGTEHDGTLTAMSILAQHYHQSGRLDKALPLFQENLRLTRSMRGAEHRDTIRAMNYVAEGYLAAGETAKAVSLFEESLRLCRATRGDDHPDTAVSMTDLALGYEALGNVNKAVPLYEEALRRMTAKLGADHPYTLACMANLAKGYHAAGQRDRAMPLFEDVFRRTKTKLGPEHPQTLVCMNHLATAYSDADQREKALPLLEETLRLREAKLGKDHPGTLTTMNNLAGTYFDAGERAKAGLLWQEVLRLRKTKLGAEHPDTLRSMNNLAGCYQASGQFDKALPLHEEALRLREAKLGADHPDTLQSMANLAEAYCEAKLVDKGVVLIAEYAHRWRERSKPGDPTFAAALAMPCLRLLKCERYREAEAYIRECLTIRDKTQPDAWTTFNTRSMLGGALLGQKKQAEAEPLLVKGYEGMKKREKAIPVQARPRLTEALERLIALYDAWGKPAEAARWRKELALWKKGAASPKK